MEEEHKEAEDQESDKGERKPKKINDPRQPTEEERRQHEMTHLPYRSWCRHCVKGRGKNAPHKKQDDEGELHEVHFDYAFMGTRRTPATLRRFS